MSIEAKIVLSTDFFQVIEVSSEKNYHPSEIENQALPIIDSLEIDGNKGVVIAHEGSVWMTSAIALFFKNKCAFVAHFDYEINCAVVVHSNVPSTFIGDVIKGGIIDM